MSDTCLGLALVGCSGDVEAYRDGAERLSGGAFALVVDADLDAARAVAEAVGAPVAVSSIEEALDGHGATFDAVVIRGPLTERLAVIRRAAEAQKHIHVEAPVATNLDDVRTAIDQCAQADIRLSIGNILRANPSNSLIKARISENKLGTPGLFRSHHWCSVDDRQGTGLVDHIYGHIDLAAWLFETLPSEIYALNRGVGRKSDGHMPDYLQVHLGFPGGGMALLDFTTALPAGQDYRSHYLIGSSGAAYADDHHNAHLVYRGDEARALVSREKDRNIAGELQDFIDAIQGDRPPAVTGADALAAHRIVEGVARSLESGGVVVAKGNAYESD